MPRPTQPSLKRTRLAPVSKAKRHWRREATENRLAYMAEHCRCMVCGISVFARPSRHLECHHLMGRGAQKHECFENYGAICSRDHTHYHHGGQMDDDGRRLPLLTPGMLLECKRLADGLDVPLLLSLKGWAGLPEDWTPAPLPAALLRERTRNEA